MSGTFQGIRGQANGLASLDSSALILVDQLPIVTVAKGGTNSATALNNDCIMISSGGSIIEASALLDGQILIGGTSLAPVAATITGTANQVVVTNGANSITVSLPQDINIASTPTFGMVTISNTPTAGTDAATVAYVQSVAQGLDIKASCFVATIVDVTLSGEQTIDGVLTSASRVLVKNQTDPIDNGIYLSDAGSWTRTLDFNTGTTQAGAFTFIEQGNTQANTGWVCTDDQVVGTGDTTFSQFSGAGSYLAGTGLILTGNTFSLADATTTTLGGVIVPTVGGLVIDGSGNISVPTSTAGTKGISSPDNITITATAGVLTAVTATTSTLGIASFDSDNFTVTAGAVDTIQDIATTSTPTFASEFLSANTNQLVLGTTNTATVTMTTLTGNRVVTLPDANSNTIRPLGSATASQFVAYVDATGLQNLVQPTQSDIAITLSIQSADYQMLVTDNKIVLDTTSVTVTLPDITTVAIGQEFLVQLYDVADGTVIPLSDDSSTINGLSSFALTANYGSACVYTPDNVNWLLA